MEALHISKMPVTIYQGTCNFPACMNLHQKYCEKLKSWKVVSDISDNGK